MGVDDTDRTRPVLDHDVGEADRREAGRVIYLDLRFEPGPVSGNTFTEFGQGDGDAPHQVTGVFRFKNAPIFHSVITHPDRQLAVRRSQKPELRHISTSPDPAAAHPDIFEGRHNTPSPRGPAQAAKGCGAEPSHPAPSRSLHLGTFEGERRRRSAGYREDYGLAKALASLAAVTAFLFVAGIIAGIIAGAV